ncbi:MAG: acyl carrier protein [Acidobacteria bacterium]|nr:acyl carrier protein [Myxococcales bacterium]MCB1055936.1 acyl carrier protein [Acidobacteriota bacterium]MCB9650821.1 acyl carrier protein [Deltaproteobacteria bacterium]
MTTPDGTPPEAHRRSSRASSAELRAIVKSRAQVEKFLRLGLAEALGISPDAVDPTRTFTTFGLDSIKAFALTGDLAEWLDRDLPATLFWDHPNIEALTGYVADVLGLAE